MRPRHRRAAAWSLAAAAAAMLIGVGVLQSGGDAAAIERQLEDTAGRLSVGPGEDVVERERRIEAALTGLFDPAARVRVAGVDLDGPRGLLVSALTLSRQFPIISLGVERVEVRSEARSASVRFEVIFTGEAAGTRRVERREVRAELHQQEDGGWRIHRLEVTGPDEADPEARP